MLYCLVKNKYEAAWNHNDLTYSTGTQSNVSRLDISISWQVCRHRCLCLRESVANLGNSGTARFQSSNWISKLGLSVSHVFEKKTDHVVRNLVKSLHEKWSRHGALNRQFARDTELWVQILLPTWLLSRTALKCLLTSIEESHWSVNKGCSLQLQKQRSASKLLSVNHGELPYYSQ